MVVQYLALVSNLGDNRFTPFQWTMFKGNSADSKPSATSFDGCMFIETDTGKMFFAQGGSWQSAHTGKEPSVGFYGKNPTAQQANTAGAGATAAGTYGANEQKMLNDVYSCLRAIGLLS
jgi:hypothetical protein